MAKDCLHSGFTGACFFGSFSASAAADHSVFFLAHGHTRNIRRDANDVIVAGTMMPD